jgi:regulator of protease activity HflC (stomatin/prohibitin superfamily)
MIRRAMQQQLVFVVIAVAALILLGVALVLARSWRPVKHGQALIINKLGGEPRVTFRGALVLPIVQRAELLDVSTRQIVIARRGKAGVICADNIRADVEVTFHVRVNHTTDDVLRVAQSVGCERASQPGTLEELFGAKFSEALKTVAKQLEFEELFTQRDVFKDRVIEVIGRDLGGYVLDDAVIDHLEQTPLEYLDPDNVLDAQGIQKIKRLTAASRDEPVVRPYALDDRFSSELQRLGLLDVSFTVEVSCDVSQQRAALSTSIDGANDELLARLPEGVVPAVVNAAGRGELTCRGGRATFRWPLSHVTDAQLVAGARLVYAFRDDPAAYR